MSFFLDILFPKYCFGCNNPGTYICSSCEKKFVSPHQDVCIYCRRGSYLGLTHPLCRKQYGIDGWLSLYVYNGILQRIIKGIKYRYITDAVPELIHCIKPEHAHKFLLFRKIVENTAVQPVPLHVRRLRERGFNQSQYIAKFFGDILGSPLLDELNRVKDTPYQAQQPDEQSRHINVRSAFSVKTSENVRRKNIILADDVVTSGSTVRSVARTLKLAGASKVFVFSLARG